MSVTIFARQREAIGLCGVCTDARVPIGEQRGQEGWEIGINYTTKDDLLSQIVAQPGHILALGISCHGSDDASDPNTFGGLAIEGRGQPWLRESNINSFLRLLTGIGVKLETNGVVYFFACRLGGTEPGRRVLMSLSQLWPNRRVVGFVVEGSQRPGGQRLPGARCELPGVQFGDQWGDWGIRGAVVARSGRIIRG
jgi:hypothetical protein